MRDNQFIVISPSAHCQTETLATPTRVGELDLGDARIQMVDKMAKWFGYWLRGDSDAILKMPKVQYFEMGRNVWRASDRWPPPNGSTVKYYLDSDGKANSRIGYGRLAPSARPGKRQDTYTYDPITPRPSSPGVALDQREAEMRNDVLVYTSEPLRDELRVVGPVSLHLEISSSAPDTDFAAKLIDVFPDQRAVEVSRSIVRARYRAGMGKSELMRPNQTYPLTIPLGDTANDFLPGHSMRVEVSSSDFPDFARNLNTGGDGVTEVHWHTATNRVHHGAGMQSFLELPVQPPEDR